MILIKGLRIGCWFGIGLMILAGVYWLGTGARFWTDSGAGTAGIKPVAQVQAYDLDRDGLTESYVLKDRQLRVFQDEKEIWRSPADWQVAAFVLADATNDGQDDLLLVVWKIGSFGRDKPFWIKEEDTQLSNHLFVLNLRQGQFKPVWFSSALDRPIQQLTVQDLNQDGKNVLVVQEETGSADRTLTTTYWQWQDWGFYRLDFNNG